MPSAIPSADKFTVRKELSSDSTLPQEEIIGKEDIIRIPICKVCKQPFSDTQEKVVCDNCKHYCHAEHSSRYLMKTLDHLCIVDASGIDKLSFMVLHGIANGYSKASIGKAAALSSQELDDAIAKLRQAGFVRRKLLFSIESTYHGREILPVLEEVYKEKDVEAYKGGLASRGSVGFSFPHISSSKLMFVITAIAAVAIMLVVDSSVLAFMRAMMFSSAVIVIVWILILLATAYLVYLAWKLFS